MTTANVLTSRGFTETGEFARKLDRLAEVAVRVGLGLAPRQQMIMTVTLDQVPLARRITEHAYKA
ncbi:MAG TPA: aminopeptidase, partial [Terriglobales bacterium]|nr:aminopeptidase [Terriglobales bacterium]